MHCSPSTSRPHGEANEPLSDCKEVHLDCCFLRNEAGGEYAATLVLKNRRSRILAAHVVPNQGASAKWIVKQVVRDLEKMGHISSVQINLRSDQEPAIIDLLRHVAMMRPGVTLIENPRSRDSQSNGFIERGIQSIEGAVRLLKFDIEERIGKSWKSAYLSLIGL